MGVNTKKVLQRLVRFSLHSRVIHTFVCSSLVAAVILEEAYNDVQLFPLRTAKDPTVRGFQCLLVN